MQTTALRYAIVFELGCLVAIAPGAVTRIVIEDRSPVADGRTFGAHGPYQRLRGKVHFAVDPTSEANRQIVDLPLAPRNAQGNVEFSADFEILAPVDPAKSNGAVFCRWPAQ